MTCFSAIGQTNKDKAKAIVKEAIKLEDGGKPDEALPLLAQAQELDPENYTYPYEVAFCYQMKKDYRQAISTMLKVMKMKDIKSDCYQQLGNLYDMSGDSVMALNTYREGLEKFPDAGRLYLETGNVYFNRKQYAKALPFYEKGIEADPVYPSNYYRAAQIYTASSESVWGMIYGEIFMNLERNTQRTATMSKWLYGTYKENIVIHSKDSMEVHFCKNIYLSADNVKSGKQKEIRLPFSMVYEPLILMSLTFVDSLNTESLCRMRAKFIDLYFEGDFNRKNPNVLFEYENTIRKAGYLDAYNHWILMKGDEASFSNWESRHQKEWDGFMSWFNEKSIKINKENSFVRPH